MSNDVSSPHLTELLDSLKESIRHSIDDYSEKVGFVTCNEPIISANCGFIYAFARNVNCSPISHPDDALKSFDIGILQIIAAPETRVRSGMYVLRSTGGQVALFDLDGRQHGEPGGWTLTYGPKEPIVGFVFDCSTEDIGNNRLKICCRIFVENPLVTYEGTHCVWFWVPTWPAGDTSDSNIEAQLATVKPTPLSFKSKRMTINNEVRVLTSDELELVKRCSQLDLRPALENKILYKGKNLFFSESDSGVQYWIEYDGEDSITFGASKASGKSLPVQLTRGTDKHGIAICHFCGPNMPGPLEGIGDCKVMLCDPIFRIPIPIPPR